MIHTQRSRRPHSPPAISKPIPVDDYDYVPVSPPMTPPRPRRPSISSPITWLTRTSTSSSGHSAPYAPSKPVRISEPKFANAFDALTQPRGGALGSGATVVRTPQEALAGPRCLSPFGTDREGIPVDVAEEEEDEDDLPEHTSRPESPPLPPIPDVSESAENHERPQVPPRPTRLLPAAPEPTVSEPTASSSSTLRPSLKTRSPPTSDYFPPVPALPANLSCSPPQSPFEPILISSPPAGGVDPSRIIVSLETSTVTHKTALQTLLSRPSFLATYLNGLRFSRGRDTDADSLRSDTSDADSSFNSIFRHHLASSGLLSQTSTSIHIFLDRPSAPYAHILTYLRSPPSTPENPAVLPRAVQLTGSSSARLEALLELRDEALYLDLDELYKLCTEELRLRQSPPALGLHVRGLSSASHGSLRSVTTLREIAEADIKPSRWESRDSGFVSMGTTKSPRSSVIETDPRASPALQQHTITRGRSRTKKEDFASLRSKPSAGWI
ncbi:hypothetical protein AcW1_004823 [Taiwanofungus camphoratus]|nr:hypothetical protein AcV7_003379 [Antrodia cinnamomea]KAI0939975.1 hypothetical protein AcV5_001207 [Antrodia cinnamomea]KAI0960261.1 hypothetical protein AcW1_004823 [Antrodia cinnamomea]